MNTLIDLIPSFLSSNEFWDCLKSEGKTLTCADPTGFEFDNIYSSITSNIDILYKGIEMAEV